jgi:membrane peptidoglycan carboxypeptidase
VSNPDFPGPFWQDKSATPDGSAAYGGGADPYGRAGDGRYSTDRARNGRERADYDANGDAGYARNGSAYARNVGARDGRNGTAGYGRNGDAAYGRNGGARDGRNGGARDGRNGTSGYGRNGDAVYGREAAGEDDLAGRIGRRLRDHGARSEAGLGPNGRRSASSKGTGDRGYPRGSRRAGSYGSNGDAGYGDTGRPGGRGDRYSGRSASYRTGAGLIEDWPTALPGFEHGDLGRGGPGGRGGPYGPGGPGGPGRHGGGRGPGGGRRGPRGLVDPDGRRVRPPGNFWQRQWRASWWRRWTLKKAALVMGAMALGTVLILIAGFFYVYSVVQLPIKALSTPLSSSSAVYFANGKTEVGSFSATNRTVLTPAQLAQNKYLEQAFFAAEDRHFLTEGGISLTGTARALFVDLTGSGHQGGSTITEQYVKTYFQSVAAGGNLTYKEKLKEIIYAIKLAKKKSKPWILSHYLNAIFLGNGAYGVEAAAQTYFGKHAWQLNAPQSAMLAAMVQAPSALDPYDPAKLASGLPYSLLERWVYVLVNMAGDTYPNGQPVLTQQQLSKIVPDPHNPSTALKNFPKVKPLSSAQADWGSFRGYIMTAVQTELENTYGYSADKIGSAGLHITTTFSLPKMRALYAAIAEAKKMMRDGGQRLPVWARVGAVLENPKNGAIEAMYGGPGYNSKHCQRLGCKFNTATVSRNQVGSSFKPYVLATAVQQGMNVVTSRLNGTSPLCIPPDNTAQSRMTFSKPERNHSCPTLWAPIPYDPATKPGPVTVAAATAASSNPAFVDLAHRVGTINVVRMAKSFGVSIGKFPQGSNLSQMIGQTGIALGIASLTVEEQASTFATLANRGNYHTPHVIATITRNGQPIQSKVEHRKVLTPKQTADVDWALSFDTNSGSGYTGTGTNAVLSPYRPTIAKTGTTDSSQAAFFIGALPWQYSFAVGMFTAHPSDKSETLAVLPSIGGWTGGYGGAWPATIWRLYMTKLLALSHKPIASLDPLNVTGMAKWILARAPKPKCNQGPGGGPGNGNGGGGHGRKHGGNGIVAGVAFAQAKCPPSQGGNPSPSPSGSPSPGPSGSPSPGPSGSPRPSGSPSASPSFSFPATPAQAPAGKAPSPKQAASTPSLTTSATLPRPLPAKPGWAVPTTGLA